MITVIISNNLTKVRRTLDPNTTLRQALEAEEINYSVGMVSLDGSTLPAGSLDNTFASYGIEEKCFLTVAVKADNAANVKIVGNTCIVEASVTLAQLKKIEASRPKTLVLYEGEGSEKEEVFRIATGKGNGHVGASGWNFGEATSASGNALITMQLPEGVDGAEAAKKWAAKKIGTGIIQLKKIEERFSGVLGEIDAENAAVESCITVL